MGAGLVALLRRFRRLTADRYEDADLFAVAEREVAGSPAVLRDVGHVILVQVRPFNRHEDALATALAGSGRLSRVIALTGEPHVDEPLTGEARIPSAGTPPLPADGTTLLTAPDADVEVRLVVRKIVEAVRGGTPAHRIAVFYRIADQYEPILKGHFAAAALPFNGPVSATLASTAAGRVLAGALRLAAGELRREDVMDWLTASPVSDGTRLVPSRRWDDIAREAAIVRGHDQWRDRLERFAVAEEQRAMNADIEERPARAERARRRAAEARALSAFITGLRQDLQGPPGQTWSERAAHAGSLLRQYLDLRGAPEPEIEARDAVVRGIEEIASLDHFGTSVDAGAFLRAVERMLESPARRHGRFGLGVFAGPLAAAAGLEFEMVFVLGMVEGQIPPGMEDDPLLPDRDRAALGPHVPRAADRRAGERRDFLAALQAAPTRVLSFPAADLRGQRKNLPSRWLLEVASHLAGCRIDTETFLGHPSGEWLERHASFKAAVEHRAFAASAQEYDLRSLAHSAFPERHYLVEAVPSLLGGIEAQRARASRGFSRWEGHVPGAPLPDITAPTRLEAWAKCPFSYFLEHVLRLEGREDPEEIFQLSPIDRGNIIHDALEEFLKESRDRAGAGQQWNGADRDHLLAIAERLCDGVERSGRAGKPALWSVERERIRADLEAFIELDNERRMAAGFEAAEFAFGRDGDAQPAVAIELPGGRVLRFRGRIDRADLSADRTRATIYDYKTGSDYGFKGIGSDPLGAGRHLQLAIYADAVRSAFEVQDVASYYWFVNSRVKKTIQGGEMTEATREDLMATLDRIATGLEQGVFPADPGQPTQAGRENCTFCPYDALCPADRARAWERKRGDPAVAPYLALGEVESDE
jgi:RecB family exonuclease